MQCRVSCLVLWMMAIAWFAASPARSEDAPRLRVATFRCDVTPPLGQTLPAGDKLATVEDPLWAKGIVLEDGDTRFVLCAFDWCILSGPAYRLVRTKVAEAANANVSRTVLHMVHQHTAPALGGRRQTPPQDKEGAPAAPTKTFLDEASDRLASAVKASLDRFQTFDRIGVGEAKVERVASNRRVPGPGGKILTRWSACKDPDLRAMPEGLIDPMVKTITFARGEKALVRLHYYATHPQSFYGDGRASGDFVAFARERIEDNEEVFQIYFTGCEGNITVGKYNEGSREAREGLAQRLMAGMQASIAATRFSPASHLKWRTTPMTLTSKRVERPKSAPAGKDETAKSEPGSAHRTSAAPSSLSLELNTLTVGQVHLLHLPGECFIEFQLFAQQVHPTQCVAVAALCDNAPGYVCTEKAFSEGGYEPTASRVAPDSEHVLKAAIRQALGVD